MQQRIADLAKCARNAFTSIVRLPHETLAYRRPATALPGRACTDSPCGLRANGPNHDGTYIVKLRRPDTLTINLVFGVQLNLSIASATNETRAFPRVGRERRIQARELVGFSDAYRVE